jgi:hypothetical protein
MKEDFYNVPISREDGEKHLSHITAQLESHRVKQPIAVAAELKTSINYFYKRLLIQNF